MPKLATDSEQLAARREDAQPRRAADQPGRGLGSLRQELLQVVEQQQDLPIAQPGREDLADCMTGRFAKADRPGNRRLEMDGLADIGEVDEPSTVREPVADVLRDADCEPGLAAPARPR